MNKRNLTAVFAAAVLFCFPETIGAQVEIYHEYGSEISKSGISSWERYRISESVGRLEEVRLRITICDSAGADIFVIADEIIHTEGECTDINYNTFLPDVNNSYLHVIVASVADGQMLMDMILSIKN